MAPKLTLPRGAQPYALCTRTVHALNKESKSGAPLLSGAAVLGIKVGVLVGAALGRNVGKVLNAPVGEAVEGTRVGVRVGFSVGCNVGNSVALGGHVPAERPSDHVPMNT